MFGAFIPTRMPHQNLFRMPLVKNLQQIRNAHNWWYSLLLTQCTLLDFFLWLLHIIVANLELYLGLSWINSH